MARTAVPPPAVPNPLSQFGPAPPASGPCGPGGSPTAGPDGRGMFGFAPMSLLFGGLSLPTQRECSPKWSPAHLSTGGAAFETGHLTLHFEPRFT